VRDLFQFRRDDLRRYEFLLHRDIFSWVLDRIEPGLLIDLIRLFNDLNLKRLNQDILGDIYEHYLDQDRPKGEKSYRQLLGQYYTPKPIVRMMWLLVRTLLQRARGRDLYEADAAYLAVLDPCYGSGTFLTEAILHFNASALRKPITDDGRVFGFVRDRSSGLASKFLHPLDKAGAKLSPEIRASKEDAYLCYSLATSVVNLVSRKLLRLR
jgi:type I restriction-modification system DNA methylase subunit